jgi:SagB-type dehydrogenase family enzyme
VSETPQDLARAYHARTKHRYEAYAEGPGQLDWDAQPAPFRHYLGAPVLALALAADAFDRPYADLPAAPPQPVAVDLRSLGALLELALGISAWKTLGPSRWALRCNPSSGNLHPVEAYVLCSGLLGLPSGLHHYDPEQHALEGRALTETPCLDPTNATTSATTSAAPWLAVALSSVMWREAWKYGERAFRYCQLDVGHAVAALSYAAALLGWELVPLPISPAALHPLLGLDRPDDFPPTRYAYTEAEEPELLLMLRAPGLGASPNTQALAAWLAQAQWHGQPSRIDPAPGYRWPVISQVAAASRGESNWPTPATVAPTMDAVQAGPAGVAPPSHQPATPAMALPTWPPLLALPTHSAALGSVQLIRQRRSGQRFDPQQHLSKPAFYRMLDAVLPRPHAPWTAQASAPRIHLMLFVLRVDGLPSGLYLLPRQPNATAALTQAIQPSDAALQHPRAVAELDPDCPAHLGLIQLGCLPLPALQRLARALHCHQDIAATGAFALGMLGEFEADSTHNGPHNGPSYRQLLREAGLIGQVLYLEAEAAGVRGTGIGCFFDDPVHQLCGLGDGRYQTLYHFTVGTPVLDARIETGPPYPQRQPGAAPNPKPTPT